MIGPGFNPEDLVFVWADGRPYRPEWLSREFERASRLAGLPRIRLHDVRHSYATAALAAGIPAKVVSERLGHAQVSITLDTYSHVLPSLDESAADRVAALTLVVSGHGRQCALECSPLGLSPGLCATRTSVLFGRVKPGPHALHPSGMETPEA